MRPVTLEVQGFTAFRDRTVVDFVGADLFALTGATGAGKSSLIDAMTFALYGVVARYDDRRLVAPVISQGALEARVRFDFEADGETYAAVRVVRSTGEGRATTKEARLERGSDGEVLAGDARGVTAEVERLLGLGFEHFTTCVVLPQGEFDQFLHEERADREKLLERLLALRQFREMASLARSRAAADQARLEVVEAQLSDLAAVSDDELSALQGRLTKLERIAERVTEARPVLERLKADAAEATRQATVAEQRLALLREVRVPEDVVQAAERAEALRQELFLQVNHTEAAVTLRDELEARADELAEQTELRRVAERREKQVELEARVAKGQEVVAEAARVYQAASEARAQAAQAKASADQALEQARRADQVQEVRAHLVDGEPCPVCLQVVTEAPDHEPSSSVAQATAGVVAATTELEGADRDQAAAERRKIEMDAKFTERQEELTELAATLEGAPGRDAVQRRLEQLAQLDRDLTVARKESAEAEKLRQRAQQRLAEVDERQRQLRSAFDAARAPLTDLDPPLPAHGDLAEDWTALAEWAEAQLTTVEQGRNDALVAATEAEEERSAIDARIAAACADVGLDLDGSEPAEAVAAAVATSRSELEQARRDRDKAETLGKERTALAASQRTAEALGRHLSAGHFTTWLLDEALVRLVDGATTILRQLTDGAYSLVMDEDGAHFSVVDHTNADAVRSARTLSGGETFLASLALALALAEQVAELAGEGAPPLESVFLDEGFGSLDVDTLDVVAAALEELGASGRMVGVVTHVRDLAERLPVRFEVRKGPHTATVERIER